MYSPQIHMLKSQTPIPQNVTNFGVKVFKEVIKLTCGRWCGALIQRHRCPHQKEKDPRSVCTKRTGHMRTQEVVICKPRSEALGETNHVITLILDSQLPPCLRENETLVFVSLSVVSC